MSALSEVFPLIEWLESHEIRPGDIIVDPVRVGESTGRSWHVSLVQSPPTNVLVRWILDPLDGGPSVSRSSPRTYLVAVDFTRYEPEKSIDELKDLIRG